MNPLILVVDDEPDVEVLFRQQFGATSVLGQSTLFKMKGSGLV